MPAPGTPTATSSAGRIHRPVSSRRALTGASSFFAGLEPAVLGEIEAQLRRLSLDRGEAALIEGETSDCLFFVAQGRLKLMRTSPEGKEHILRLLRPGDSFNEVAVLDGGPAPATVIALEPAVLYTLRQGDLEALMRRYPAIARLVIQHLTRQLRQLVNMVEDLSFKQVSGRLAKLLLAQSQAGQRGAPAEHITQQDMASMIGAAREVVARSLRTLEDMGAIRVENRRVVIVNRKILEDLA
jgi:CRP-like cAMP-binding protein